MRFYRDRPDVLTDVQWFFVDDRTPWVGVENVFNSRNWYLDTPEAWPQLGEVEGAARPWVSGAAPGAVQPHRCELTPAAWIDGVPFDQADALPHTPTGVLYCCLEVGPMPGVDSVRCDDGSLIVSPSTGDVEVHINTANQNTWTATQTFYVNGVSRQLWITTQNPYVPPVDPSVLVGIDASLAPGSAPFNIYGDRGFGPILIVRSLWDGRFQIFGGIEVDADNGGPLAGVRIRANGPAPALHIVRLGSGPIIGPRVRVETGGGVGQFQIDANGEICTNQTQAATATGAIILRLPLYDAEGVFLGYMPVYDDL